MVDNGRYDIPFWRLLRAMGMFGFETVAEQEAVVTADAVMMHAKVQIRQFKLIGQLSIGISEIIYEGRGKRIIDA